MLRRLSRMTLIASISVMLLSCVSTMACVGCSRESRLPVKAWELNPQESFGLITVKIKSTPLSCQSEDFQEQSCETEELGLSERITTSIGSSIVVGKVNGTSTTYVLTAAHVCASDTPAIANFTNTILPMEDEEIALLTPLGVEIYDSNNERQYRNPISLEVTEQVIDKMNFKHYMLKEIYDQPEAATHWLEKYLINNSHTG